MLAIRSAAPEAAFISLLKASSELALLNNDVNAVAALRSIMSNTPARSMPCSLRALDALVKSSKFYTANPTLCDMFELLSASWLITFLNDVPAKAPEIPASASLANKLAVSSIEKLA